MKNGVSGKEEPTSGLIGNSYFHFRSFYDMVGREAPQGASVVEIGVLHGHSLIYLKELRPDLDLIGVDWGRGVSSYAPPNVGTLVQNLIRKDLYIPILLGDSSSMARFIPDKSLWLVFIDGDHSEEGLRKDIEAWAPKVMDGGILAGDDYGDIHWPDVKRVVDELYPSHKVMGTTWIRE